MTTEIIAVEQGEFEALAREFERALRKKRMGIHVEAGLLQDPSYRDAGWGCYFAATVPHSEEEDDWKSRNALRDDMISYLKLFDILPEEGHVKVGAWDRGVHLALSTPDLSAEEPGAMGLLVHLLLSYQAMDHLTRWLPD